MTEKEINMFRSEVEGIQKRHARFFSDGEMGNIKLHEDGSAVIFEEDCPDIVYSSGSCFSTPPASI